MSDVNGSGLTRSVYEIFEMIMAVSVLLIIGTAIFYVSDPQKFESKAIALELSYISTMIDNTNVEVKVKYEDKTVEKSENEIIIKSNQDKKITEKEKYFGNDIIIENQEKGVYLIRS